MRCVAAPAPTSPARRRPALCPAHSPLLCGRGLQHDNAGSTNNARAQHAAANERPDQPPAPPSEQAARRGQPSGPVLAGAATTLAATGAATYTLLASQPQLPPLGQVLGPAAAVALGCPAAALLLAKALLRDRFHVELHRGRLHISAGVPSHGPPVAPGAVLVRPCSDPRLGNGAFAAVRIPAGTYLGDYTGEMLDRSAFHARYPDGVGDFAAAIDGEWTVDAVGAVADTRHFHPVHMNHSRGRANVGRFYRRAQRRISFFTLRAVEPEEELLYDYGRAYWRGREHLELP